MLMDKNIEILETDGQKIIENEFYVGFKKPYEFEGAEYAGIDLSGLENLSANNMIKAQKIFERSGNVSVLPEMSMEYCCIIAADAAKQPIEFFKGLPMKEGVKVKNRVTSFLFGQD